MNEYNLILGDIVGLEKPKGSFVNCHFLPDKFTHNSLKKVRELIKEHYNPKYTYTCIVNRNSPQARIAQLLGFKALNPFHPEKVTMILCAKSVKKQQTF